MSDRPPPHAGPILVIDDDPAARGLVTRGLIGTARAIVETKAGFEGLMRARAVRPCAIVLDLDMPGLNGWTLLRALQADPMLRRIPVLTVSVAEDRDRSRALGGGDHLVKPVAPEHLRAVVERLIGAGSPAPVRPGAAGRRGGGPTHG